MNGMVLLTCLGIVVARLIDVSLGTLRTAFVVQGRYHLAWTAGFFEILIWAGVVSNVMQNLSEPVYAIAYALGYATGNALGISCEQWLAFGNQVVCIFTHYGTLVANDLRAQGFHVTSFYGENDDGPIEMLFVETPRKRAKLVIAHARSLDPECAYIVEDVRAVSSTAQSQVQPAGWHAAMPAGMSQPEHHFHTKVG